MTRVFPPGWKPTREQMAYRQQVAADYWQRLGCTAEQIRVALGLSQADLVRRDLHARGIEVTKRYKGSAVDPPPVDWLNPPPPSDPAPDDQVALIVRHFLHQMTAARWRAAHANDVLDRLLRHDEPWLRSWADLAGEVMEVARVLVRQHAEDPAGLRGDVLGWAEDTAAAREASDSAPVPAHPHRLKESTPAGLREEIWEAVSTGRGVRRRYLAVKYETSEAVIQREHLRARAKAEVIAEGWTPPTVPAERRESPDEYAKRAGSG